MPLIGAFVLGALILIPVGTIENQLIPRPVLSGAAGTMAAFWGYMGVGIIEGLAKFLPLALYIYHRKFFNEHTDGVIYFALCGLGFGLAENIGYTLVYGAEAGIARVLLVPVFHAATTAIAGYYLAEAKLAGRGWGKPIAAVLVIAVIHGFYDFGLGAGNPLLLVLSITITGLLTASLFAYYRHATERDAELGIGASAPISLGAVTVAAGAPAPYPTTAPMPPRDYAVPSPPAPVYHKSGSAVAVVAVVLALLGLIGILIPIAGVVCAVLAFVLGIKGLRTSRRGLAMLAIVLAVPVLILAVYVWTYNAARLVG